jgi:hypothetical protein
VGMNWNHREYNHRHTAARIYQSVAKILAEEHIDFLDDINMTLMLPSLSDHHFQQVYEVKVMVNQDHAAWMVLEGGWPRVIDVDSL